MWGGDIELILISPAGAQSNLLSGPDRDLDYGSAGGVVPTLPYTFSN